MLLDNNVPTRSTEDRIWDNEPPTVGRNREIVRASISVISGCYEMRFGTYFEIQWIREFIDNRKHRSKYNDLRENCTDGNEENRSKQLKTDQKRLKNEQKQMKSMGVFLFRSMIETVWTSYCTN